MISKLFNRIIPKGPSYIGLYRDYRDCIGGYIGIIGVIQGLNSKHFFHLLAVLWWRATRQHPRSLHAKYEAAMMSWAAILNVKSVSNPEPQILSLSLETSWWTSLGKSLKP